ncbi:increased loss of mitochondrial DNA protein 1 [Chaetomium tenue]|uniref:Increased loss of mitochondrial DNA protein 1 n=1 Tax=Chaetomium tenue TaxID=1854479 RepID=A0ACB7NZF4_9PEZI|nr:increased loss of mitochondrial DNA protein 1 [Chaetomium globosum]
MALISAKTILTSLCFFHITLGFFFLTNPNTVADQPMVQLLGESMGLPDSRSFETPSPALGFLAVILAFLGITDLVTLSLPDEICLVHYWGMQAPLRLTLTFLLSTYSFFFSASSPLFYSSPAPGSPNTSTSPGTGSSHSSSNRFQHPSVHRAANNPGYTPSSWGGDVLKNRVFFTFMFVETMSWFWVWVTLQEERRELLTKKARRRSSSGAGAGYQY